MSSGNPENPELVRVSRAMSRLLRHHPPPGAMDMVEGWVTIPDLLRALPRWVTEDIVRRVVATSEKGRFAKEGPPASVRATQGHSVRLSKPILRPVRDARAVPCAVHATSEAGWAAIRESGELRRMGRTHVHFATREDVLRRNAWATVWLLLDVAGVLRDAPPSCDMVLSDNGVLLLEGPLPVAYVARIEHWPAASSHPADVLHAGQTS